MKKKIINAAVILVIASLAISGLLMIYGPFAGRAAKLASKHEPEVYVDAKELTLRLSDSSAEHYIRMDPVLAVRASQREDIELKIPKVRDRILTIVSGQDSGALASPEGEQKLKQKLLDAFHKDFGDSITDIYFSGYLVE